MYRPCNSPIESVEGATVIKQQWLLLQEQKGSIHPHQVAITDIIEAIKKKQKEGHEILIALDGNMKFTQAKGGIARLCHECKLHDPVTHLHGTQCETKSHIRGTHRIDFYLCTYNLLKSVKLCRMIGFNDITTSDHYGLYSNLQAEVISNPQNQSTTSPFERKLNSKSPQAIRTYNKYVKKKIEQKQCEKEETRFIRIACERKLITQEEKDLNQLDKQITQIIIKAERNIKKSQ